METLKLPDNLQIINRATFKGCNSLISFIIPASVEVIYQEAFADNNQMENVKVLALSPPFAYDNSFSKYDIPLYVPEESVSSYQSKSPWSKFAKVQTLDGQEVETLKCATPTISIADGEIVFSCETDGVAFVSEVTAHDAKKYNESKIVLTNKYIVSVYATKDGYENSDVVTEEISLGGNSAGSGDVNGDGVIDVSDYIGVANIILTGSIYGKQE